MFKNSSPYRKIVKYNSTFTPICRCAVSHVISYMTYVSITLQELEKIFLDHIRWYIERQKLS